MMCLKQKRPSALVLRAQAAIKCIAKLTPQSGLNAPPIQTRMPTCPGWAEERSVERKRARGCLSAASASVVLHA